MTSFAELKSKRDGRTVASPGMNSDTLSVTKVNGEQRKGMVEQLEGVRIDDTGSSKPAEDVFISGKLYGLDDSVLQIRHTKTAGRGIFANKAVSPGTVLLRRKPHIALLDKKNLPLLCSTCMSDVKRDLQRCSGCKVVWYCSTKCQRQDWKPHLHKLECAKLKLWSESARKAGRPSEEHVPDTPVRAIGRLLMLREHSSADWWTEVDAMAGSPRALTPEEQERHGSLALAVTQYVGEASNLRALFPELSDDPRGLTQALLGAVDKFGINSFSLTQPDLTNIGVAVCPVVALVNHSCVPNCAVVFPDGPDGEMKVVAFKRIEAGEELLSSYLDLTMPLSKRQQELQEQYKFECICSACQEAKRGHDLRRALKCDKGGCSGYVPLPDSAQVREMQELACIACKTGRTVCLTSEDIAEKGLSWAIEQTETFLRTMPGDAEDEPAKRASVEADDHLKFARDMQRMKNQLIPLLRDQHRMALHSHPLLALNRMYLEHCLEAATGRTGSSNASSEQQHLLAARSACRDVLAGLERIYPIGHPVRAVQQAVLGKLLSVPDFHGGQVTDVPGLRAAYEQVKRAHGELEIGYGRQGVLISASREELVSLERDIMWRTTAQRSVSGR